MMRVSGLLVILLVASAVVVCYFGLYNVAADVRHSAPVSKLLEVMRERSIARQARDIDVPPLDDVTLIAGGARHYAAMCAECHLAPGKANTEIRQGLYPQPPDLFEHHAENPAEQFWIIKHGIKMTGMPAWGATHDDEEIWSLVAFLQKLPDLSPGEYETFTANDAGPTHGGQGHHHAPVVSGAPKKDEPAGDAPHDHDSSPTHAGDAGQHRHSE